MRLCVERVWLSLSLCLALACGSTSPSPAPTGGTGTPAASGVLPATAGGRPGAAAPASGGGTSALSGRAAVAGSAGASVSAGTSASGAAGMTPAAVGGSTGSTSQTQGDLGERFVSGAWHGYVWTSAIGMGSSITPMDFKSQTTGMPRCVKGSVAATSDYSGTASLGFDLAEDSAGAMMTVVPTQAGVAIDVANHGASELRLQVQGPDGSATGPWCAPISGNGGFIPWTSFNTKCWDKSGAAYNKEPLAKLSVLVPGMTMASVAFDFCVNSLAESAGTSAAGSGGATGSAGLAPPAGGSSGAAATTANAGSASVTPVQGGCDGYATGYWDCCKPHCGWKDNVQGSSPLAACDKSNQSLGSNYDAKNACEAGGTAYMCQSLVPWAVNDKLAYGYAAVPAAASQDVCGRCYQLDFLSKSFNAGEDPGTTAIAGKTMIVQATNIGSDVQNGQFDIAIPGRGVGMYDACSSQWGVPKSDLGETYGGFLPTCKTKVGRTDHAALKACVMQSCMNVFEAHGLKDLAAGCEWFVNWFEVADNPSVKYKAVACPAELMNKGLQRNVAPANSCLH